MPFFERQFFTQMGEKEKQEDAKGKLQSDIQCTFC